MKKNQILSILAAMLMLGTSALPLNMVYADDGAASDETNQPSDDKSDTNNDSWQQIGGGNNGADDGSGELKDLETHPSQPTEPTQPTVPDSDQNQSSSNNSGNTGSTSKPNTNTGSSSSNKTQTSSNSNNQKPQSTNQNHNSTAEPIANETADSVEPDSNASTGTSVETKTDKPVTAPETGAEATEKSFAIDFRLAGIIAAIVIVVCGLTAIILISLRRNRKATRTNDKEDLEEAWTTDETVEDDFEFPAIDLDVEEKKIKTTKAAKAAKVTAKTEAKTVKAEQKSAKKSDKE